jgi:hypothetical protein
MIPKQYDDQHRAFYAEEDGVIRAEEGKPATADSAKLKSLRGIAKGDGV